MKYLALAFILVVALCIIFAAIVVVMTAFTVIAVGVAMAWLLWKVLPLTRQLHHVEVKTPVERLTDHYVAGHIDIREFEQQLSQLLRHQRSESHSFGHRGM